MGSQTTQALRATLSVLLCVSNGNSGHDRFAFPRDCLASSSQWVGGDRASVTGPGRGLCNSPGKRPQEPRPGCGSGSGFKIVLEVELLELAYTHMRVEWRREI